jgi:2,5-dichlorohydroquinone reductive dechlorinase
VGVKHDTVAGTTPRFELFRAANSICSQKVRAVLAHHAMPYVEHG